MKLAFRTTPVPWFQLDTSISVYSRFLSCFTYVFRYFDSVHFFSMSRCSYSLLLFLSVRIWIYWGSNKKKEWISRWVLKPRKTFTIFSISTLDCEVIHCQVYSLNTGLDEQHLRLLVGLKLFTVLTKVYWNYPFVTAHVKIPISFFIFSEWIELAKYGIYNAWVHFNWRFIWFELLKTNQIHSQISLEAHRSVFSS